VSNPWDADIDGGDGLHREELVQWDGRPVRIVMRLASDGEYRRVEFPDGSRLYLGRHGGDESDAAGALVRMLATAYGEEDDEG
jgi:hypothetical protein